MRILMISWKGCIRCHKEAIALINRGHTIHMVATIPCSYREIYESFGLFADRRQLASIIRAYDGMVDVIHVQNEPSWYAALAKEVTDIPVIMDIHDSNVVRVSSDEFHSGVEQGKLYRRLDVDERTNFELADGLVFVSEGARKLVTEEYGLTQPSAVIPCACPVAMYSGYQGVEWLGGLAVEGLVHTAKKCEEPKMFGLRYTNFEDVAIQAQQAGIGFYVYSNNAKPEIEEAYGEIAYLNPPVNHNALMPLLARHDWGLVGNSFPTLHTATVLPNKLFDYIAAGVPVVCWNADAPAELVKEYGFGIEVNSLEELKDRWDEGRQCRKNIFKHRRKVSMDAYIPELETLYKKVIDD